MINPWFPDERQVTGEKPYKDRRRLVHSMSFHFSPGSVLTLREAIEEILSGRYLFVGEMCYHSKWTENWSINFISRLCKNGMIRKAEEL